MERMFAPWRRAFIEGKLPQDVPSPSGCIFCDFPKDADDGTPQREWDQRRLVVTRRDDAFVILNKYPYNNGHVMVVPYVHTQRLEDAPPLEALLRETVAAVRAAYAPHGLNVGMNMGKAGGAGIDEHIHWHVLPRWNGDSNFMPAIMVTKVISESLDDTWERLAAILRRPDDDA